MNNLIGGTRTRLSALRASAAKYSSAKDWRSVRFARLNERYPQACPGFNGKTPILSAFDSAALPVRSVQVLRGGWIATEHETINPIVCALPHGKFLSGYTSTDTGEHVLFQELHEDEDEAKSAANSHAEHYAEQCAEQAQLFDAMRGAEYALEESTLNLQKAIALRHHPKLGGFDSVREALEAVREAREALAQATMDYENV